MALFLAQNRGKVVRISGTRNGNNILPFRINFGIDNDITDSDSRVIITQANLQETGNYQLNNTLNEDIYAYIFGDKAGMLTLGGVCFTELCGSSKENGIYQVIKNYNRNKISKRGRGIPISFGEVVFTGFLVEMGVDMADVDNHIAQWRFNLRTVNDD